MSVEELAQELDITIPGLDSDNEFSAFDFTPFQRLLVRVFTNMPATCSSTVVCSSQNLKLIASSSSSSRVRTQPIEAERVLLKGSCPDFGIVDTPTAAGKTATVMSIAAILLGPRFNHFVEEYRTKQLSKVFDGTPEMLMARLAIFAVGGSVFEHFVSTAKRIIPQIERKYNMRVVLWTKNGIDTSTLIAGNFPDNVMVFWIMPVKKLMEEVRKHPKMGIACVVPDEFTVEPPREKSNPRKSPIMKYVIPQATPQNLKAASRGKSFLSHVFGGPLEEPSHIETLIRYREYSRAELASTQVCQLDLSTCTVFREWTRHDLSHLMPPSLTVFFAKSKRCTLSSHLLGPNTADLLPASPKNIILASMNQYRLSDDSIARITSCFDTARVDVHAVCSALDAAVSLSPMSYIQASLSSYVQRTKSHLLEYQSSCPVCFNENSSGMNIFSCCGYCVCDNCYSRCTDICFFCRQTHMTGVDRNLLPSQAVSSIDQPEINSDSHTFESAIISVTNPQKSQVENLLASLRCLKLYGYNRLLLVANHGSTVRDSDSRSTSDLIDKITDLGICALDVDPLLSGKGRGFTAIKKRFDNISDTSVHAFCTFSMESPLCTGTNLDNVNAMVVVGGVPDYVLVQLLGRVLRPNVNRDNSRTIPIVKIFS